MGQYRNLTADEKAYIVNEMIGGRSTITKVLKHIKMDDETFVSNLERDPEFRSRYTAARDHGYDNLADSLMEIYDVEADVQRARGKSDNIKWYLSKVKARTYGDRIDVNVTQTLDIAGAIEDAKSRVQLPLFNGSNIIEAQSSVISDSCDTVQTDTISVNNTENDDIFS